MPDGAAPGSAPVSDSIGVRSTTNAAPAATTTNRATAPTRLRNTRACADNGPRAVHNTPRNVTTPSAAIAASTIGMIRCTEGFARASTRGTDRYHVAGRMR